MADMTIGGGVFKVDADLTGLDRGLIQAERKTRSSFARMGKVMAGTAVIAGGAMTAAFAKAVSGAIEQQHAFQETFTLLPDTTEKEFGKITDQAKKMAARLNVEWKDMSKGLYNAISAGIPKDNILSFMEKSAEAAAGGVATLNQAVNVGTTVMNAMTNQGLSSARAFDILFSTVRKGKTTIPELADSIGYLLPVANSLSVPLEQISAMISTLTASGIKTRVAMTSIRAGLSELADPAYKAGEAIQELTGKSFYELIKAGGDVGEILNMLYEALGPEKMAQTFGLESRAGMLSLVSEGYKKYKEDLDAAVNSSGAAREAFEKMAKTIKFQLGVAVKTLSQTLISFGAAALPIVSKAIQEDIMPAITKLSDWFIDNEDRIKQWFEDTWAVAGPILKDFVRGFVETGKVFWKFASFVISNKALMVASLVAMGIAMTAAFGPAAPIIVGLGMLVTLFGNLKKKWDDIVDANPSGAWFDHGQKLIMAVADGMRAAAVSLWNALLDSFSSLKDLLPSSDAKEGPLSNLTAHGESIVTTIASGIASSGGALFSALKKIASEIDWKGFFVGVLAGVVRYFARMGFIAMVLGAIWTAMGVVTLNPALILVGLLTTGMGYAVNRAATAVVDMLLDSVSASVEEAPFVGAGVEIIATIGRGVLSAGKFLFNAVASVFKLVLSLLPFSDASTGPFSDLTARGASIVTILAEGVSQNQLAIGEALRFSLLGAVDFLSAFTGTWFNVGLNIVDAMAAGIITGATAIYNALSNVFASLRNLLPFSDAKEGPLSNLTLSGQSIVLTLANGIKVSAKSLSKETQSALAGLEGVLLGDGWMPSERDIEHAIGNRLSFTNFVEKGEGLIRSIDWRGLVSGGVGDIQRAAGIGETLDPYSGGLGSSLLQEAKKKAAAGKEGDGLDFGGGGFNAEKMADEVEKAVAVVYDAFLEYEELFRELSTESLIPSLEEIQAGINPIIEWFKNAFDGVIDLSFLALPKWLSDDDGYFKWPDIQALIPTTIVIPAMDFSTWKLPPWLSDKDGYFEWPTPDDFAWTSNTDGIISAPTWPTIIWPKWLSDDDGNFMWPTPDAFVWPKMPNIDWSNVVFPPFLTGKDGSFQMPTPGPFPYEEWRQWGVKVSNSLRDGFMGTPAIPIVENVSISETGYDVDWGKSIPAQQGWLDMGIEAGESFIKGLKDYFLGVPDIISEDFIIPGREGMLQKWGELGKDAGLKLLASVKAVLFGTAAIPIVENVSISETGYDVDWGKSIPAQEGWVNMGGDAAKKFIKGLKDHFLGTQDIVSEDFIIPGKEGLLEQWAAAGKEAAIDFLKGIRDYFLGTSDTVLVNEIIPGQEGMLSGLLDVGKSIIGTISDGVDAAKQSLYDAIFGVFNWVKDLLFPASDAKEGPFSDLTERGKSIIKTMSDGITSAKQNIIDAVTEVFKAAMNSIPDLLGISLPIWLQDDQGNFLFPEIPSDWSWPSVPSITWPSPPEWLKNDDGHFAWPSLPTLIDTDISSAFDSVVTWLTNNIAIPSAWIPNLEEGDFNSPFKGFTDWLTTNITPLNWLPVIALRDVAVAMLPFASWLVGIALASRWLPVLGGGIVASAFLPFTRWRNNQRKISLWVPVVGIAKFLIGIGVALVALSAAIIWLPKIGMGDVENAWGAAKTWIDQYVSGENSLIPEGAKEEIKKTIDQADTWFNNSFLGKNPDQAEPGGIFTRVVEWLLHIKDILVDVREAYDAAFGWAKGGSDPISSSMENTIDSMLGGPPVSGGGDRPTASFVKNLASTLGIIRTELEFIAGVSATSIASVMGAVFGWFSSNRSSEYEDSLSGIREEQEKFFGSGDPQGSWLQARIISPFEDMLEPLKSGEFWDDVGNGLVSSWETYLETDWPAHRDLIQAGIWNSITGYGGDNERPEGVSFSGFWKALGNALYSDWTLFIENDWPTVRDFIQLGLWNSLTGYGGISERPEGVTFSDFWIALGTELKTDWDSYLETDWPGIRTTIQTELWNSLTGYDGITVMPEGLSFSSFWSELGGALLGDFKTFIANDWPGIQAKIVSLWNQALGLAGSVFEEVTGQPEDNLSDAALSSLIPGGQLAGSVAMGANADSMLGKKKLWHVGRPFGMWPTQEGDKRKARSPKGLLPNIPLAGMLKGVSAISAIDAGINLLEIWVPAITGTDLDTHWINVLKWIRENVATKWLSDETLTAMENFSSFLIEAGATGGAFEKIGETIGNLVTDVEKLYSLEPPKPVGPSTIIDGIVVKTPIDIWGEASIRGIEIVGSAIWDASGWAGIAAAIAAMFPWVRRHVVTNRLLTLYVAIEIIGFIDKFVLEPLIGDYSVGTNESAWEAAWRRIRSSIFGEHQMVGGDAMSSYRDEFWQAMIGGIEYESATGRREEFEAAKQLQKMFLAMFTDSIENMVIGTDSDKERYENVIDRIIDTKLSGPEFEGLDDYAKRAMLEGVLGDDFVKKFGGPDYLKGEHEGFEGLGFYINKWVDDFIADQIERAGKGHGGITFWDESLYGLWDWFKSQYTKEKKPLEIDMSWLSNGLNSFFEAAGKQIRKAGNVDMSPISDAFRSLLPTWLGGTGDDKKAGKGMSGHAKMIPPKAGFIEGLMAPDGLLGGMLSKLPQQIQDGLGGGAVQGMLIGDTAGGAISGLIQGIVWWLSDKIKEAKPNWSEVRTAITDLFNPSNWFSGAETATAAEGGEDTGAFSWLTTAWASTLKGMTGKVTGWIPGLIEAFSPESGWYESTITIFDPLLTGVAGILITMETSFQNTVTVILGFVEQVKNAWSSALGVVLAAKKRIMEGKAENAALARSDLTYGYTTPEKKESSVAEKIFTQSGWGIEIPGNAAGGITRTPFVGMVGEAGPELIIPLGRMSDILSDAIISSGVGVSQGSARDYRNGGRGGGGDVVFNITGDVYGFDDFENKIGEVIVDLQRTGKSDIARSL